VVRRRSILALLASLSQPFSSALQVSERHTTDIRKGRRVSHPPIGCLSRGLLTFPRHEACDFELSANPTHRESRALPRVVKIENMTPKDIQRRLFGPIAIQDRENRVVSVDLAAFTTRLLLFDTYILQSIWLQDLILLQHSFGTSGLSELFEAGALKFQCAAFTFGQTGQARSAFKSEEPRPSLPLFHYQFSVLRVQGEEAKVNQTLAGLDSGLRAELIKGRVLVPADYSKNVFEAFYRDLTSDLLNSAVEIELRRIGIIPVSHHLHVDQREDDEFAIENDLSRRYLLPAIQAHRIIETAMMALGRLDERIASMQAYSALSGLSEKDRALLDAKLGATAGLIVSTSSEQEFSRVATLKGLPVPEFGSSVVDVKTLLKIRDSDECRSFKEWLSGSEALSDKEVRERVSGFARKIRLAVHSRVGKAVRFVVSNGLGIGLGLVTPPVGLVAGVAVAALDSFLLETLIPKDAVISFLSESYPSLFKPSGQIKR